MSTSRSMLDFSVALRTPRPSATMNSVASLARTACSTDFKRGMAALVVAVAEHDQHPPSRLLRQLLQPADDDVVERGAAPRRELIDGAQPLLGRRLAARVRVNRLSLNAVSVTWSFGAERRQELLHRRLQLRHRAGHALADIHGDDQLQRRPFRREVRDLLRHVVFEQPERRRRQALDEAAAIVHDGGHLHDLDAHRLDQLEALGPHARDRAVAADHLDDGANHVLLDSGPASQGTRGESVP